MNFLKDIKEDMSTTKKKDNTIEPINENNILIQNYDSKKGFKIKVITKPTTNDNEIEVLDLCTACQGNGLDTHNRKCRICNGTGMKNGINDVDAAFESTCSRVGRTLTKEDFEDEDESYNAEHWSYC